jgi:GT2 family glycosyltransferase
MNGTPGSYTGTAEYIAEFSEYMPQFPPRFSRMIPTCNLSVRREVFEAVGRFEEVNTAEDTLFCHRITELGYKIRFDPSIRISHHNRVILNKFLANQLNLGYGSAIVRRTVPMVGTILLKHISLQIFIPFIKMLLIGRRAAVAGAGNFLNFLFHAPLIFTGCCFYTVGFARGARVHINKKA